MVNPIESTYKIEMHCQVCGTCLVSLAGQRGCRRIRSLQSPLATQKPREEKKKELWNRKNREWLFQEEKLS